MSSSNPDDNRDPHDTDSDLPLQVREQPDPLLQLSVGRLGTMGKILGFGAAMLLLILVFYGLNATERTDRQANPMVKSTSSNGVPAPPPNSPQLPAQRNGPGNSP